MSVLMRLIFSLLLLTPNIHAQEAEPPDTEPAFTIAPVASNLHVPWSIVFTDRDRMLVSERNGTIVEIIRSPTGWEQNDYYIIPKTEQRSEAGLMGLAIHPNYVQNQNIYAMYAYEGTGGLTARVSRFTDSGSSLISEEIVLDNIPCAQNHCGGRIAFGPDDQLYISVGDAQQRQMAQDSATLHGKILRVTDNGAASENNPFGDLFAYSIGHRNVQGLTWHPETEVLFATEHGPSGIDGLGGGDEINVIQAGNNYGWPLVSHREENPEFASPAYIFSPDGPPAVAPAAAHIVQEKQHPWYGNLLVAALHEGDIIRCALDYNTVTQCENLGLTIGRIRDIAENSEGELFFSTSNQDGRSTTYGTVTSSTDDAIYQLHVRSDSPVQIVTPRAEDTTTSSSWLQKLLGFLYSLFDN